MKNLELGYDEKDFVENYWLDKQKGLESRINRSVDKMVLYFLDLFDKMGCRGSVLDIGAGAGNIVYGLRQAGIEAEGCEFSSSGRKLALDRFNVLLSDCDLRKRLPYSDDSFDWSICVGVLSMIPVTHIENAVKEILRVTKLGVLVNVQTSFEVTSKVGSCFNLDHLTFLSSVEYWSLFNSCGAYDWTSIQPPQKSKYGIGVLDEFAGLFSKGKIDK